MLILILGKYDNQDIYFNLINIVIHHIDNDVMIYIDVDNLSHIY